MRREDKKERREDKKEERERRREKKKKKRRRETKEQGKGTEALERIEAAATKRTGPRRARGQDINLGLECGRNQQEQRLCHQLHRVDNELFLLLACQHDKRLDRSLHEKVLDKRRDIKRASTGKLHGCKGKSGNVSVRR